MPELPEVEITRRGIAPFVENQIITGVVVRESRLRWPVPRELGSRLKGLRVRRLLRRGKYLLFDCGEGWLIVHLGMTGSLRLVQRSLEAGPHEHIDIEIGSAALRLRDPRRFGAVLWTRGDPQEHRLLAGLGVEPLSPEFTTEYLFHTTRNRRTQIKPMLMNSAIVAGIGNIYANESLFHAGISPRTRAGRLTRRQCDKLACSLRATLEAALAAGGSSLRDFVHSDGSSGWFQQHYFVYDRTGEACRVCGTPIRMLRLGQRSSFYCPVCQK
jgi:formamidopyrimidine-DNA glycosylase